MVRDRPDTRQLAAEPALMLIAARDGFPNLVDEAGLTELLT